VYLFLTVCRRMSLSDGVSQRGRRAARAIGTADDERQQQALERRPALIDRRREGADGERSATRHPNMKTYVLPKDAVDTLAAQWRR